MPARAAFVYLHGFASGPGSSKARLLRERFAAGGVPLVVPDLNLDERGEDGFETLTVTRMLRHVREDALPRARREAGLPEGAPVVIAGSSLGGYTAALVAAREPSVVAAVLLAPAFAFAKSMERRIRAEDPTVFERGWFDVFHYARGRNFRISTDIVTDGLKYEDEPDVRCPTLILHGLRDDVVPIARSREFSKTLENVRLVELDDEHQLGASGERIWEETRAFVESYLRA